MATASPTDYDARSATYSADQDVFRYDVATFALSTAVLAAGTDGALSGTTFTSAGANFTTAGIAVGDVIEYVASGTTNRWQEGEILLRVTAVTDANNLAVARLDTIFEAGQSFAAETSRPWQIKTMDHWRRMAWREIGVRRGRLDDPEQPITSSETGDDADQVWRPEDLLEAEVLLTLAKFWEARWSGDEDAAALGKAERYQNRFDAMFAQVQILTKLSGESRPSARINPGVVKMRRV